MKISDVPEIYDYIVLVRSHEFPVCQEQLLLCGHVEKAFKTEDLRVDTEQLRRYMAQEKSFPFRLFPWERFCFALQNCVYRPDGLLRWPNAFIMVGRGTGKNGYVSFTSWCWLTPINGVRNYDVDIFANSEDQAMTSFMDVRNDVLEPRKPKMQKFFKWNSTVITNLKTNSSLRFRTSGVKTKDGGRPGAVIFDEYHAYTDYDLVSVARTGLGKKQYPREIIITTDGNVRGGPLDDMKSVCEDILRHDLPDNGTLPFICKLDSEDEVDTPAMWHKANPSLRYFPTLQQEISREYAEFHRNPIANKDFLTKRMNLPKVMDAQSVASWDQIKACQRDILDGDGRPVVWDYCDCVAGIDYAKTTDFVSAGLLFRYGDSFFWMQHTWVCTKSIDLPRIKAPLDDWAEQGYITMVDAPEISPELPVTWLEDMGHQYNIVALGMDNFRFTLFIDALKKHGFDVDRGGAVPVWLTKRVTMNRYAPVITSLFNTGNLAWGSDPMMSWYTWNTSVEEDRGNQYYAKKEPHGRKTDGFFALVSAVCSAKDLADSCHETGVSEQFETWTF